MERPQWRGINKALPRAARSMESNPENNKIIHRPDPGGVSPILLGRDCAVGRPPDRRIMSPGISPASSAILNIPGVTPRARDM